LEEKSNPDKIGHVLDRYATEPRLMVSLIIAVVLGMIVGGVIIALVAWSYFANLAAPSG
jgi:F0F1-type ATP synthase assembly protein I